MQKHVTSMLTKTTDFSLYFSALGSSIGSAYLYMDDVLCCRHTQIYVRIYIYIYIWNLYSIFKLHLILRWCQPCKCQQKQRQWWSCDRQHLIVEERCPVAFRSLPVFVPSSVLCIGIFSVVHSFSLKFTKLWIKYLETHFLALCIEIISRHRLISFIYMIYMYIHILRIYGNTVCLLPGSRPLVTGTEHEYNSWSFQVLLSQHRWDRQHNPQDRQQYIGHWNVARAIDGEMTRDYVNRTEGNGSTYLIKIVFNLRWLVRTILCHSIYKCLFCICVIKCFQLGN